MAQNSKRGRNNNRRRQGGSNPNRSLDSNGPEVKIRGTAAQIFEKYQALARDAASAGDRIRAESLSQHAEHYYRMMKAMQPPERQDDRAADRRNDERDNGDERDSAEPPKVQVETNVAEIPSTDAQESGDGEAVVSQNSSPQSDEEEAPKPRRAPSRKAAVAADTDAAPDAGTNAAPDASADDGEETPKPRRRRSRRTPRRAADDAGSGSGDDDHEAADETAPAA